VLTKNLTLLHKVTEKKGTNNARSILKLLKVPQLSNYKWSISANYENVYSRIVG